jgi:hypothetical protein
MQQSTLQLPTTDTLPSDRKSSLISAKVEDVVITVEEEKQPLLAAEDPVITINTVRIACCLYYGSSLLHNICYSFCI